MVIIPEVALQRLIQVGIAYLKEHPEELDDIFSMYTEPAFATALDGDKKIADIKTWFLNTKIPVLMSWNVNNQTIPSISVHLSDEMEDETSTAIGDEFLQDTDEGEDVGISPFVVSLDIGVHVSKDGNYALWLYYIVQWILFSFKRLAEAWGLQMATYRVGDFNRNNQYLANNIWSRWFKVRTSTFMTWSIEKSTEKILEIELLASRPYDDEDIKI